MSYVKKILGDHVVYGLSFKRFILGIYIDESTISLDFGFIWIMVELK